MSLNSLDQAIDEAQSQDTRPFCLLIKTNLLKKIAAQICRGYVYILPIIFISILYNIPKFYEVETTTHCQLQLDGTVSFRILKKKTNKKNKDNHPLSATTGRNGEFQNFEEKNKQTKQSQPPIVSYNWTER